MNMIFHFLNVGKGNCTIVDFPSERLSIICKVNLPPIHFSNIHCYVRLVVFPCCDNRGAGVVHCTLSAICPGPFVKPQPSRTSLSGSWV